MNLSTLFPTDPQTSEESSSFNYVRTIKPKLGNNFISLKTTNSSLKKRCNLKIIIIQITSNYSKKFRTSSPLTVSHENIR
uniref:Uncharacterized protein n=1 Tax=Gossypium raimondii TaxID=29730 RepID=A0A0D2MLM8_GOSRA|nr:hypothetical protein B456_003G096000 [Gossypium raimondii]